MAEDWSFKYRNAMAQIAIIGVGAIGGVVATLLERTELHRITLCTRRQLEKLTVKTAEGLISTELEHVTTKAERVATKMEAVTLKTVNATDPMAVGIVDWVLVATKVYDVPGTSAWLQRLCGKDTPVAILQNGVEHRENFAAFVNPELILPVIIDCPAERQENGNILQRGTAQMVVENNRLGTEFAALFRGSKAEVRLTDDFLTAAWQKLCLNASGAISALLVKPAGVLQDKALGEVVLELVAECVAVGKAEGARLDEGIGQQILERYRSQPPDSINSILADRIAGRPMEIDARNGVIVRKGEKHGIRTPVNKMVVALLKA
jgi:2-dehydropantoate 2-reductase